MLPMRSRFPPTHRIPSKSTTGASTDPWMYVHDAFDRFDPCSTSESDDTLAMPDAVSNPPAAKIEFAQPCPLAPKLPHGHAIPVPSPAHTFATSSSFVSCTPTGPPNPPLKRRSSVEPAGT